MTKLETLNDLTTLGSAVPTINDNFDKLATAIQNTVSRDGSGPNFMQADLDMNSNDILNVNKISVQTFEIDGLNLEDFTNRVEEAAESVKNFTLFDSRANLVAYVATNAVVTGRTYIAGGVKYVGSVGSTVIRDLPGLVPSGDWTPLHFGSFGALKAANTPYLLSDVFPTLSAAQAVYPKAEALTQTVDDMAFQSMVDAQRGDQRTLYRTGETPRPTANNSASAIAFHIPRGEYYLTRSLDMTNIRFSHTFWRLSADSAVIYGHTPLQPIIDMTGSRKCQFEGTCKVIGLWVGSTVSDCGLAIGRDVSGVAADCHAFVGGWEFVGRYRVGGIYNRASEDVRYGYTAIKNDLDPRVYHCPVANASGPAQWTTLEDVTWSGGAGVVKFLQASGVVGIRVTSGAAPTSGATITGGTSGKVVTVSGAPAKEPDGCWKNGRSFCLVQDGDCAIPVASAYMATPAPGTPASFLRNIGTVDLRHTGFGHASFFCRAVDHDFNNSYFVASDPACGTVLGYANSTAQVLRGCKFDMHVESDFGDLDPKTGLGYGFIFEAANPGTAVTIDRIQYVRNTVHASVAEFAAGENVSSVALNNPRLIWERVARDVGQKAFLPGSAFTIRSGEVAWQQGGAAPFFNISELANISGTFVTCQNATLAHMRHATGSYVLRDTAGQVELYGPAWAVATAANSGWAGTNAPVLENIDSFSIPAGSYNVVSGTTIGTLPSGATVADTVMVQRPVANQTNQFYVVANTGVVWFRASTGNTGWNAWRQIADTSMISWGKTTPTTIANIDATNTPDGPYQVVSGTTTGTLPAGATATDSVLVLRGASSQLTQIYVRANGGGLMWRGWVPPSAWTPWRTLGRNRQAGEGGAVTQATSKTTAVTMNDVVCGSITTSNSALAAGAEAIFEFNSNLITGNSIVSVGVIATNNNHSARVISASAGRCSIAVKNETAGSLSQAVGLRFNIDNVTVA